MCMMIKHNVISVNASKLVHTGDNLSPFSATATCNCQYGQALRRPAVVNSDYHDVILSLWKRVNLLCVCFTLM